MSHGDRVPPIRITGTGINLHLPIPREMAEQTSTFTELYVFFFISLQYTYVHGIYNAKLSNYTVGILQERGVVYNFDYQKVAPAVDMGMDTFEHNLEGFLNVRFVHDYLPNKGTCMKTLVGAKIAEMYHSQGIDAVIGPCEYLEISRLQFVLSLITY